MTNDDRFDELLQEAAREHNSPPDAPRAEMWAAIAAARRAASASAAAPNGEAAASRRDVPVRVIPLYARHRRTLAIVAGLAATLFVGVVIGRGTRAAAPAVTEHPSGVASTSNAIASPNAQPSADNEPGGPGPIIKSPIPPSNSAPHGATTIALAPDDGAGPSSRAEAATGARRELAADAARPYRVAAMQHLVTTEALLVSLRGDVRAGRKDTTIAVWAGDLLGTTRMLIDSPAGRDPQLKQLLEDLELVLAQISRLPGAHGEAADLGLIDDAVRHRQIMTRLRALSPDT